MPESPEDRLTRIFGMGEYGRQLAKEILGQHTDLIIKDLMETGLGLASTYLEGKRDGSLNR